MNELVVEDDNERIADLTVDSAADRLLRKFGLDPRRDAQVLWEAVRHRKPADLRASYPP